MHRGGADSGGKGRQGLPPAVLMALAQVGGVIMHVLGAFVGQILCIQGLSEHSFRCTR